jgi:hypothetical protein
MKVVLFWLFHWWREVLRPADGMSSVVTMWYKMVNSMKLVAYLVVFLYSSLTFAATTTSWGGFSLSDDDFDPASTKNEGYNHELSKFLAWVSADVYEDFGLKSKDETAFRHQTRLGFSLVKYHDTQITNQSQTTVQGITSIRNISIGNAIKRVFLISIRGTDGNNDIVNDILAAAAYRSKEPIKGIEFVLKQFPEGSESSVPSSFYNILDVFMQDTESVILPHDSHQPDNETLKDILDNTNKNKNDIFILTGHSLGGAIVTLLHARLINKGIPKNRILTYTYGSPPVGNKEFSDHFSKDISLYRIFNEADPVASTQQLHNFVHVGTGEQYNRKPVVSCTETEVCESELAYYHSMLVYLASLYSSKPGTPGDGDAEIPKAPVNSFCNVIYFYQNFSITQNNTYSTTTKRQLHSIIPYYIAEDACAGSTYPWYIEYILYLNQKGIMKGYKNDTIQPNKPVTRAEFLKLVIESSRTKDDPIYLFSVPKKTWYEPYISIAKNSRWYSYLSNIDSQPQDFWDKPITRQEAVHIVSDQLLYSLCLYRNNLDSCTPKEIASVKDKQIFTDIPTTSQSAKWINYFSTKKYISGYTEGCREASVPCFKPNNNLTRAEASSLICKALLSGCGLNSLTPTHIDK